MSALLVLMWAGAAHASCPVDALQLKSGERSRHEWRVDVKGDADTCKALVLGPRAGLRLDKVRVSLRQWDDGHLRLGSERVFAQEGSWVLHTPEIREGDQLRVRVWATGLEPDLVWSSPEARGLGVPVETAVRWAGGSAPVFGPGGSGTLNIAKRWVGPASAGVRHFWLPDGAQQVRCEAKSDDALLQVSATDFGCAFDVAVASDELEVTISWSEPGAASSKEWSLEAGERLSFPEHHVASAGLKAVPTTDGVGSQFIGPGRVSVRLLELDGETIAVNSLAEVEAAARFTSIPEPGLGIGYKGRRGGIELAGEIIDLVQEQVQNGRLPAGHPLKPRQLMEVRRSGWATPWEQALLLTRYLGQLRIPASAYPVRPAASGLSVSGSPEGYVGAVVSAGEGADMIWLDPSCRVCGVGEISPELWGGRVFSSDLDKLPSAPEGSVDVALKGGGSLQVSITGVAALRLRRWLLVVPAKQRGALLAEMFGGAGAELEEHSGFPDLGQPISMSIWVAGISTRSD